MATRTGIQLAYPFSEKRLTTWHPPYLVQPKLDGERCRAIVGNGVCLLLSSSEEIIPSVPHINSWIVSHFPPGEYDGELYIHGHQQNYIHSIVSKTLTIDPRSESIEYHIFDLITKSIQADRISDLARLPSTVWSGPVQRVQCYIAWTHQELLSYYNSFISDGYEGFIVRELSSYYKRKRSTEMMKFKPKQRDEYLITGIYEAISEGGKPLGMLGGFSCIDDMNTPFRVGAGKLNHEDRKAIWKNCTMYGDNVVGKLLEVEYQTKSGARGVPIFSRAVRIIPVFQNETKQ